MVEYKSYINALRQCAKEHENELVSFAHIRTTDLCNDTANLLEKLEIESDNSIPIPEGATNGDVIKAMFPNCEQKENIHNGYFEMYFDGDFGNPSYMRVREYWWDAPYRKVEE